MATPLNQMDPVPVVASAFGASMVPWLSQSVLAGYFYPGKAWLGHGLVGHGRRTRTDLGPGLSGRLV